MKENKVDLAGALAVARTAAVDAGDFLLKRLHSPRKHIQFKTSSNNLVTAMDRAAEERIVRAIRKAFPDHGIVAEERPPMDSGSLCRWLIDPLDGTTNYAHGFPVFSVSIGLECHGRMEIGVVYNPNLRQVFWARRGRGAYCNRGRLKVSRSGRLRESLLATGFPYDLRTSPDNNVNYFIEFLRHARAIRRAGSAALDLCYVAAGIFDGFWEIKLGPWDIAAASLIAAEAGARLSGMRGEPLSVYSGNIVAGNAKIHTQMLQVIRRALRRGTIKL